MHLSSKSSIVRSRQLTFHLVNTLPNNRCFGFRPYDPVKKEWGLYQWETYSQVRERKNNIGKGLVELHAKAGVTGSQFGVGLWCQNRPEWQITGESSSIISPPHAPLTQPPDLGCQSQSLFTVSIYDTLGPDTTEYILNHSSLTTVVASLNHIPTLLKLKPRCPSLKYIVSLDPVDAGELPGFSKKDLLNGIAAGSGVEVVSFAELEALGAASSLTVRPPKPDDIITINYTSGTTGAPKGVVLTQRNALAASSAGMIVTAQTSDNAMVSYLPLAHIYERVNEQTGLAAGTRIGFFHGNVLEVVEDMKILKPTSFTSVPRLYNRFGSSIRAATLEAPGFRGTLSKHVVDTKLANLAHPTSPTAKHWLWDRIWSKKVVTALGLEKVQFMVSGSAPLDPSLHQFLRAVTGVHFIQGYGLTESYAVSLVGLDGDLDTGHCGPPAPCVEACIADVPDMDYLSTDKPFPRGELLLRGPSIFREYFKNADETNKSMTEDGWFRTGDVVTIDHLGRFKVIDRKKNVLKLAQGEYVSPERIENVYLANCPWIQAAYVHGDSTQAYLVMIGSILPDMFATFAGKVLGQPIDPADATALEAACTSPKVQAAALKELDKVGKQAKMNNYERVRNLRLMVDPFTIENELLTPTLKLKRPQTVKMYRAVLDEMYAESEKSAPKALMGAKL